MYINIGIAEPQEQYLKLFINYVNRWSAKSYHKFWIKSFRTSSAFLSESSIDFDIIFADSEILSSKLFQERLNTAFKGEIIILSDPGHKIFGGFSTSPMNYLLKPFTYDQIAFCLNLLCQKLSTGEYLYQYRSQITKIPYHDILFFSSRNHHTEIMTLEGVRKQAESLKNIAAFLPRQFYQCHRTAIVNLDHVQKLSSQEVILSDQTIIPVSQPYRTQIREGFIHYNQNKKQFYSNR